MILRDIKGTYYYNIHLKVRQLSLRDYLQVEVKWSHLVVSDSLQPPGLWPIRFFRPWDFPGKSAGVDCHFLLQGIFPTQESNSGLLHCGQMLYLLIHQGSPISRLNSWQTAELGLKPRSSFSNFFPFPLSMLKPFTTISKEK